MQSDIGSVWRDVQIRNGGLYAIANNTVQFSHHLLWPFFAPQYGLVPASLQKL